MLKKCYAMGIAAAQRGEKCIPVNDKIFMEFTEKQSTCKPATTQDFLRETSYSKAWIKGWLAGEI